MRPSAFNVACTFGARRNAGLELLQRGPRGKVDLVVAGPVGHNEQVGVGDREFVAREIRLRRKAFLKSASKRFPSASIARSPRRPRALGIPERTKFLVDFGRDEREPLHGRSSAPRYRIPARAAPASVGDVLQDDIGFADRGAVVKLQEGHVAFWIDRVKVGAVRELVHGEVDLHGFEGQGEFVQRDVRGLGSRSRASNKASWSSPRAGMAMEGMFHVVITR